MMMDEKMEPDVAKNTLHTHTHTHTYMYNMIYDIYISYIYI